MKTLKLKSNLDLNQTEVSSVKKCTFFVFANHFRGATSHVYHHHHSPSRPWIQYCKEAKNVVQNLISKNDKTNFDENPQNALQNPKKPRNALEQLGLTDKRSPLSGICLESNEG